MSVFFQQNALKEHLIISPTNSNLELTGNFTIEFFLKTNPLYASQYPIILTGNYSYLTSTNLQIYTNRHESPNSIIIFQGEQWFFGTTNVNNNAWHHVAVVRNGTGSNNLRLYIDGQSDGVFTTNNTINYNIGGLYISKNEPSIENAANKFQGSLSNLRIVKGTGVYTSNFTPPTSALTSISGTSLLLFTNPNNLFVDGSPNNYTVTKYTSPNFPTASADVPFVTGFLTSNGTDLSSIFSAGSSLLTNENTGTRSGATTYNIPFLYDRYPGQVIFYTNGPTYSGVLIANMYWGVYSNTINTIVNIGNAFSSVTCFYSGGEFITITMNAGVTQEITYFFRRM
jgi:hypothetical protein